MNPKIINVFSVLLVVFSVCESRVNVLDITTEQVYKIAVERNVKRPVIVHFTKSNCGGCLTARRLLEDFARENSDTIDLAIVDFDKTPSLREKYEVRAIPTTRAFNKGVFGGQVQGPGWRSIKALAEKYTQ